MKILCYVNQAEAFRKGIDAPHSSVQIEVDPSKLTQAQRDFIADDLRGGRVFGNKLAHRIVEPRYEGFLAALNKWMGEKDEKPKAEATLTLKESKPLISEREQRYTERAAERALDSSHGLKEAFEQLPKSLFKK